MVYRVEPDAALGEICFGNFTLQALYDLSEGFQRRQLILQAKPKDPDRVDDPFIDREILENEAEGVLLWLLEGLNALTEQLQNRRQRPHKGTERQL